MDPIPLRREYSDVPVPTSPNSEGPLVFLDHLKGVDLPEEGEIRFRYSRRRKTETETQREETVSYELCLKAITDICDCEGKEDDGMSDYKEPKDAEEAMDRLMDDLEDEDLEEEDSD